MTMIFETIENNDYDVRVNLQVHNAQFRVAISVKNLGRPVPWNRNTAWYATPAAAFAEVPAILIELFDGVINPRTYPDIDDDWAYDYE
jgi:hypothetical protein